MLLTPIDFSVTYAPESVSFLSCFGLKIRLLFFQNLIILLQTLLKYGKCWRQNKRKRNDLSILAAGLPLGKKQAVQLTKAATTAG